MQGKKKNNKKCDRNILSRHRVSKRRVQYHEYRVQWQFRLVWVPLFTSMAISTITSPYTLQYGIFTIDFRKCPEYACVYRSTHLCTNTGITGDVARNKRFPYICGNDYWLPKGYSTFTEAQSCFIGERFVLNFHFDILFGISSRPNMAHLWIPIMAHGRRPASAVG